MENTQSKSNHKPEQQMYRINIICYGLKSKSFNSYEMREIEISYAPRTLVFVISELFQLDHIDTININLEQTPSVTIYAK